MVLLAPLVLRDVGTIENECLRRYKKTYMQSVIDCLEFIPAGEQQKKREDAWEKMLRLTNEDLPQQTALLVVPLPNGTFKRDADGKLVQERKKVKYEEWWVTQTSEGKAFSMWLSLRKEPGQEDITLEYLESLAIADPNKFDELADIVGELTKPSLGNESSSEPEQKAAV